jgi:hypothetical protein
MAIFDFLKPRWKHSDPEVRRSAVKEIDDQQVLYGLSVFDPDYSVRRAAMERLSDPRRLKAVVCGYGKDEDLCELAWDSLTDQSVLAEIVGTMTHQESCWQRALGKITDQSVIPGIVANLTKRTDSSLREVREAVLGCATDESVILQIAQEGLDLASRVRVHAQLGLKDRDEDSRGVDLPQLLSFLWEVAQRLHDRDARDEIVERVYEEARRNEGAVVAIQELRRQKDRQRLDELKKFALQQLSRGDCSAAREFVFETDDWFDRIELIERLPNTEITKRVLRTLSGQGYRDLPGLQKLEERLKPLVKKMLAGGWTEVGKETTHHRCSNCRGTGQYWENLGAALERDVDGPYQCWICGGQGKVKAQTWQYSKARRIVKIVLADGKLSIS